MPIEPKHEETINEMIETIEMTQRDTSLDKTTNEMLEGIKQYWIKRLEDWKSGKIDREIEEESRRILAGNKK